MTRSSKRKAQSREKGESSPGCSKQAQFRLLMLAVVSPSLCPHGSTAETGARCACAASESENSAADRYESFVGPAPAAGCPTPRLTVSGHIWCCKGAFEKPNLASQSGWDGASEVQGGAGYVLCHISTPWQCVCVCGRCQGGSWNKLAGDVGCLSGVAVCQRVRLTNSTLT